MTTKCDGLPWLPHSITLMAFMKLIRLIKAQLERAKKTSVNERILFVCIFCFTWILSYKLVFTEIDEIFPKASQIGEVTFNLFCSVIASGIFYYFVVYLENSRIARIFYPSLNNRLKTFGVGLFFILRDLYTLKGMEPPEKIPHLDEFKLVCENINLRSKPSASIVIPNQSFETWFEYFYYYFQSDNFLSNQLYSHIQFLTPEILKALDEIQYSQFQRALDHYMRNGEYDKLSGMSGPLWVYLKNLEILSSSKLK